MNIQPDFSWKRDYTECLQELLKVALTKQIVILFFILLKEANHDIAVFFF